jgi:uncharacterized protein YjbI with pentapeptide repeats
MEIWYNLFKQYDAGQRDFSGLNLKVEGYQFNLRQQPRQRIIFSGINFESARLESVEPDQKEYNLQGINLSSANFGSAQLQEVNLSGADLSGADLSGVIFENVDLSNANLSGANLSRAILGTVNLTDANLSGANLQAIQIRVSDLTNANLSQANLASSFINSNLNQANLNGADLSNACFDGANLNGVNLRNAKLDNASFKRVLYNAYSLGNCSTLNGADLRGASLIGVSFREASLNRADLRQANLQDTDLYQAQLANANLSGADLRQVNLGCTNLENANLSGANLSGLSLRESRLKGAILRGALLKSGTTPAYNSPPFHWDGLDGIDLSEVDLSGLNLSNLKFINANLSHTNFNGANLSRTKFLNANLSHADLSATNLTEADFSNAVLNHANLNHATLEGINLSGASLDAVVGLPSKYVLLGQIVQHQIVNLDLSDADLSGLKLNGADLKGVNLRGANFSQSQLVNADLSHADLTQANLTAAILRNANGFHANLSEANLTRTNFIQADLREANLANANLTGANLTGVQWQNSYLKRANFNRATYNLAEVTQEYVRIFQLEQDDAILTMVRDGILANAVDQSAAVAALAVFAQIQSSVAAPHMLELWHKSKAPAQARQWLEADPGRAIAGLLPVVAENKKLAQLAIEWLQRLKRQGNEAIIQAAIATLAPAIAQKVQAQVFESPELLPFEEHTTPDWLRTELGNCRSSKKLKPIKWLEVQDLPPLVVQSQRLNDEQMLACLDALSSSTLDNPHPLVAKLKVNCTTASRESFIWRLFELWVAAGAPTKEKWAMLSLGLLGTDGTVLKLAPLIRVWPGESQHARAVLGLDCLRVIGTDTALMQINGIAQKVKFQALKKRAQECMEAIARNLQLTAEQLEDRVIPDCGLDSSGQRIFDFGARQFRFALGPDFKPFVRDSKGKLLSSLPKPNAKDDLELAIAATADWKLMKKQIGEVVKIQSLRLEQAMIGERRWPWAEFNTLLAQHSFMTHLVQRLVWGGYDANGQMIKTFRVAEDQTFADALDASLNPQNFDTVGILHPLTLSPKIKAAWGQALSEYEIIPPFPQIDREIYTLQPEELNAKDITRFKDIQIPAAKLVRTLEGLGWQRGRTDQGEIQVHCKYFPKADVTAVVGEYENVFHGGDIGGTEAIDGCCFVSGQYLPEDYPRDRQWVNAREPARLPLGEIDPLLMSEVLRELTAIANPT